jgi:acyl-CoA thioester hydrolase
MHHDHPSLEKVNVTDIVVTDIVVTDIVVTDIVVPKKLNDYPTQTIDTLRYCDTDRQGHVNNAVFSELCECGRVDFLYPETQPLAPTGCSFVIAKLTINFLRELNWPGSATIGTGVAKVGRSSITLVQGIFKDDQCVATAESVIVLMDQSTRKSATLPDSIREALRTLTCTLESQ